MSQPEDFAPLIRIKNSTKKRWVENKLRLQGKIGKNLMHDDFARILLNLFEKASEQAITDACKFVDEKGVSD